MKDSEFVCILVYPDGSQKKISENMLIHELYYKLARVPHVNEHNKVSKTPKIFPISYVTELKKIISLRKEYIPLFDIYTKNIYIIEADNVYTRVIKNNFRIPNEKSLIYIRRKIDQYTQIVKSYKNKKVPVYYTYYLEQLHKHINFLSNYHIPTLHNTFYQVFYTNNPISKDMTNCVRPSFIPTINKKPYYTKNELINMALNLNIKIDINNLDNICSQVSNNDIDTSTIYNHIVYIKGNNAKAFIQFYTFTGSSYINSYLRYPNIRNIILEKQIFNLWSLIQKAPEFDKNYYVYRFVSESSFLNHLKIGDIYEEHNFMSTTRNPFYNPKNNLFGYVLIKIKLPKNKQGVALCLEAFSFFKEEEELLLAPCKLRLTSKDDNFTYYHLNKAAQERIHKKFEFEYIETIKKSPLDKTKDYQIKDITLNEVDFMTTIEGDSTKEKLDYFYNSKVTKINDNRYFKSKIGDKSFIFQVYYRENLRAYDKYFFFQKPDHMYWIIQDEDTLEIILFIELREKISVNFLFRYIGGINPFDENILLLFLASISQYFGIDQVIIHDDYTSYEAIANDILINNKINIKDLDNPDTNSQKLLFADRKFYPIELINYINSIGNYQKVKYIPRFSEDTIKYFFKKDFIIELSKTKATDILKTTEYNPIINIYNKFNKITLLTSFLDFYLYLHYNAFYLLRILNKYLKAWYEERLQPIDIWDANFNIFKPFEYLYKKGIISEIPNNISYENIPDVKKSYIIKKIREGVDIE